MTANGKLLMIGSIILGSIVGTQMHSFWVGLGVSIGLLVYGTAFLSRSDARK